MPQLDTSAAPDEKDDEQAWHHRAPTRNS